MKRPAAAAVLCALSVASALAAGDVPFRASIDTAIEFSDPSCVISGACLIEISGPGQATHMGRISIAGPSMIDFNNLSQEGTSTLTAADGSTLVIHFQGSFVPTPPFVTFSGSWIAVSGTRRFADAAGGGAYFGSASLVTNTGELHLDGRVADTGRH